MYHIYVCDAGLWGWFDCRADGEAAARRVDELNDEYRFHPHVFFVYRHQSELPVDWTYESVRS